MLGGRHGAHCHEPSDQVPSRSRTWRVARERYRASPAGLAGFPPSVTRRDPQQLLTADVQERWPDAMSEYRSAVPGHRFRLDLALPAARLAVEVDGFAHHGKYLRDFRNDRERRQNLLTLHGRRIPRFAAGQVRTQLPACLAQIARALEWPIEHD